MLKIVCVKHGTKYNAAYVNKLYDMIRRNTTLEFEFICFTEDATGLLDSISTQPLPDGVKGWWNKVYLFAEGLFEYDDRIAFFDLDTIITGNIDKILKYDGQFAILEDFYCPNEYGSAIMLFPSGFGNFIWDNFLKAGYPNRPKGDQQWIREHYKGADFLQHLYPELIKSYKVHCKNNVPPGTAIVCFHGVPMPHQVTNGWVPTLWKTT